MKPQDRPFVDNVYATADLPDLPQRDYRIPAAGWVDAPADLLELGIDIGEPVEYKRRNGRFLLWRAGPPIGKTRYLAVADDLTTSYLFELNGKTGTGVGPGGFEHHRFRTWKEALRDA